MLGESRADLDRRFGREAPNIPSRHIDLPRDFWVGACFWRCTSGEPEDAFTYYGGTRRLGNRVLTVGTCSPIYALPDGVRPDTRVPSGMRWNGYRRVRLWPANRLEGLQKIVTVGSTKIKVTLRTGLERVMCAWLQRTESPAAGVAGGVFDGAEVVAGVVVKAVAGHSL